MGLFVATNRVGPKPIFFAVKKGEMRLNNQTLWMYVAALLVATLGGMILGAILRGPAHQKKEVKPMSCVFRGAHPTKCFDCERQRSQEHWQVSHGTPRVFAGV
jgi:H+/gluconate symporter-like permease